MKKILFLLSCFAFLIALSGNGMATIDNGGFETEDFTGWDMGVSAIYPVEFSITTDAHSGAYAAKGSIDQSCENGWIAQTFIVPQEGIFSFYYKSNMQGGNSYDGYRILSGWNLVDITTGTQITSDYFNYTIDYTLVSYDLRAYAGQPVRFRVYVGSDETCQIPADPPYEVLVDDVRILGVTIEDILAFFDQSVEDGSLEGRGRGWLAKLRLYIMREMLVIAGEFIENEQTNYACYMQKRAYKRCDGQRRPYDFIIGESVPELANMISDLMCSLDCKGCPKIYSAILNYYLYDQDGDGEEEDWIEIELVDEDGNPISGVKYKIICPDGSIIEGTLDANGTAHEELTSAGPIDINFPDLSYGSWEKIEDGLFSMHS